MNTPVDNAKAKKPKAKKSPEELIKEAEKRLAQVKARAALQKRREAQREREAEKRKRFHVALSLSREEDAQRKIKLGGVVIASGVDKLDEATLCGLLIESAKGLTPDRAQFLKEQGLKRFAERKAQREAKK